MREQRPAQSSDQAASTGTSAPVVRVLHVLTGPDGRTLTHRCAVPALTMEPVGDGLPPVWASDAVPPPRGGAVWVLPVGWRGGWHRNPSRQWVVPLSGRWWVQTQDGVRTEMGPGEVHLGDDLDATPDEHGRTGHDSGVMGDEPLVVMIFTVAAANAGGGEAVMASDGCTDVLPAGPARSTPSDGSGPPGPSTPPPAPPHSTDPQHRRHEAP